jgi:catechol 2,3-dioxygenase
MDEIHPSTRIGAVSLTVSNLSRSLKYYQDNIGFRLRETARNTAYLGAGGRDLLLLTEDSRATRPPEYSTGLYHFAILTPSRLDLAHALSRLVETNTPLQGFSDHLVSEAIYLADPDGNGIEIYRDRPREEWPLTNGRLRMASDPLDLEGLSRELVDQPERQRELPAGTIIGHMHLKVSRIDETERFYRDVLGFSLMQRFGPAATFLSAGGYHHHIGANTWAGTNAPPPPAGSVGLRWFEVLLPDEASLASVVGRLEGAGIAVEPEEAGMLTRDPSGNGVYLRLAGG